MKRPLRTLGIVFGAVCAIFFGLALLFVTLGLVALLPILTLSAAYGWILFSFFHYRYGRQEEFLHLLRTVAEAKAPLAPALWAYLLDRPHGLRRETWVATLL